MDHSGERESVSVKLEDFVFFFFLVERKTKRTKMAEGKREETKKVFLGNVFLEFVKESGQFFRREREK